MLEFAGIGKRFGGLAALAGVSFAVPPGGLCALIGPNGAGKSTCFAVAAGFVPPDEGRVRFDGRDVTGWAPHRLARAGLVRTFQIVQPFAGQTVRDNIAVGAYLHRPQRSAALAHAEAVARRLGLGEALDQPAGTLPIAGRKRLELARALAADPRMLLLDEVMAGLNPAEIDAIVPVIEAIHASGVTILLIEHVMQAVVRLAREVWVLANGSLIAHGSPAEIAADERVVEAYLGQGAAARLRAGP